MTDDAWADEGVALESRYPPGSRVRVIDKHLDDYGAEGIVIACDGATHCFVVLEHSHDARLVLAFAEGQIEVAECHDPMANQR